MDIRSETQPTASYNHGSLSDTKSPGCYRRLRNSAHTPRNRYVQEPDGRDRHPAGENTVRTQGRWNPTVFLHRPRLIRQLASALPAIIGDLQTDQAFETFLFSRTFEADRVETIANEDDVSACSTAAIVHADSWHR
jgi:hypothetical protein